MVEHPYGEEAVPGRPMSGIRVLEVAQFMFAPASGAILGEWGADVLKIEHPASGDAIRGLQTGGTSTADGAHSPIVAS